jgi:phospholipid/cholesterol/gamma-HCH transport system substrate-binding protein
VDRTGAGLARAQELGGVAKGLAAAVPSLARLESEQTPLYKQTEAFNECMTKVIYPAGNTKLQDGASTTGVEDYKEFWYSLVGLDSIGQGFTGNGPSVRFLVGNSGQTLRSQPVGRGHQTQRACQLLARSPLPPLGTRPPSPPKSRRTSRWCRATRRRCRTSTGPLSQGPADGSGQG